jgi:hypothetical protein
MWTYVQESGELLNPAGVVVGKGYSGCHEGLNNPALQNAPNVGPIPQGEWTIGPPIAPPDHLGPLALPLTAVEGEVQTFGRFGFFIHGDTAEDVATCQQTASHGCVILSRQQRAWMAVSDDKTLLVVKTL